VRNLLPCPNSKHEHRDMWTAVKVRLQQRSCKIWWAGTPRAVSRGILSPVCRPLPLQVPHWLSAVALPKFYYFLLGEFKICLFWDWSNFRSELKSPPPFVSLWPGKASLWYVLSGRSIIFTITSSHYSLPLPVDVPLSVRSPQHPQADTQASSQ
jgi:hypothetical protein